VYEFLICVERPGMPPYPSILPKSDHFLFLVTYFTGSNFQKIGMIRKRDADLLHHILQACVLPSAKAIDQAVCG